MIAVADIVTRLNGLVASLNGRIQGAAEFSALMKSNALPTVTPAAFVLPLGLQGGQPDAVTGLFSQMVEQVFGVVLVLRNTDRIGGNALAPIDALIADTIEAIVGWGPDDAVGVFRLTHGDLVSMVAGTMVYQLDVAITDQLRIAA